MAIIFSLTANFIDANKFIGISNPNLTWADAQTYCQTYYTDLASSLDSTDNSILTQIKYQQGDSWIGLNKVIEPWKWSDGTNASNIP
ncbi:macrophage mannose receptor 1-like isoform X6, partial [Clarias magur]